MTLVRQMPEAARGVESAGVHLLLGQGEARTVTENPEQVMKAIEVRATLVSSVLEGILLEPHDEQWEFVE